MIEQLKKYKSLFFVIIDVLTIIVCFFMSIIFLDEKLIITNELKVQLILLIIVYQLFINIFRLYQNMIRYEMGMDYIKYIYCALLSTITVSVINLVSGILGGYYRINVLTCIASAGFMIVYRLIVRNLLNKKKHI